MTTTGEPGAFGLLLQRYRAAAGLSQDELAERAELSRRGISDLERGQRRSPHPATARRLAEALGLGDGERGALLAAAQPRGAPGGAAIGWRATAGSVAGKVPDLAQALNLDPIHAPPETHYATSGGVHIAYQTIGNGPIDVVFVMGWVTHLDYFWLEPGFARFLRRLASFSRLIVVDKRGTGLSDRAVGLPSLEECMDDIRAVMDAVGSPRAALLGHSGAGATSILFAATYPERTTALVLVGATPRGLWAPDWPWSRTLAEQQKVFRLREQGWGRVDWAMQDLERRAPSAARDESFARWWATYLRMGASPGAATALTQMGLLIDTREVLTAIRVPTLIVHRTGDQIARVEGARYMADRIPGARYVELPGDDHLIFVGDHDEILTPVEDFLGVRRAAEPDTILATVLAIEIGDAADVVAELGGRRWQGLQQACAELVRRALEAHRGRAVTLAKECSFAVFDGPSRAIRCAQMIVEESSSLGVAPRAGLHTGEYDLAGGEPGGLPFRIAAWVMAQAGRREVLVTNTVRDLVSGSGIVFQDTSLSSMTPEAGGPWRLYRVDGRSRLGEPGEARRPVARRTPGRLYEPLTPREREVVGLVARGCTNREIAEALVISERTVENHMSNVLGKLGLETRAEVAIWALRRDLTSARASA